MVSPRTKKAFNIMTAKLANNEPVTMGAVLREAGFALTTADNPKLVTNTKGWQELLNKHDAEPVLDAIYKDCFDSDKRNATDNRKLFLTITNRMPKADAKVVGLFQEVGDLQKEVKENEDTRPDTTSDENKLPPARGATGSPEVQ